MVRAFIYIIFVKFIITTMKVLNYAFIFIILRYCNAHVNNFSPYF